ncbi:hypothetical protein BCR34DRAFT_551997, partial [Clohesyomyces aquaticus]
MFGRLPFSTLGLIIAGFWSTQTLTTPVISSLYSRFSPILDSNFCSVHKVARKGKIMSFSAVSRIRIYILSFCQIPSKVRLYADSEYSLTLY